MSETSEPRQARIKEIFASAISLGPASRIAALDDACGGDLELRQAVEALLDDYESAQHFFAQFPQDFARDALASTTAARTFSPGDVAAGRFRIVGFLGAGGMGEVYEADDLLLAHEQVALKTLPPGIAGDAHAIARLKREMTLARQVTHLNVCRVFDVYEHLSDSAAPIAFFTMELLRGETLAARLRRSASLSTADATPWVQEMAAALGTAHAAGIIHGDFKPGNVMIVPSPDGRERLVITDFGLARRASTETLSRSVNTAGKIWGTPFYMAPEQFAGQPPTRASDVYALAAVAFELVTGKRACDKDSAAWSALDATWRDAIRQCLGENPAARLQTVDELVSALTAVKPRSTPRWRWSAGLAALGLVGLLLILQAPATLRPGSAHENAAAVTIARQQNIAVLGFTNADGTPEGQAFSRGLAAVLADQLDIVSADKPRFSFAPAAAALDPDANSPIRVHRMLGADMIVTGRVEGAAAQRHITMELHHASAQQPTLMQSRRIDIGDRDQVLPQVRTQLAEMLGIRVASPSVLAVDSRADKSAAVEVWYVRGRGYLEQGREPRLDAARADAAIGALRQAIQLDDQYAPAYAALSEALTLKYEATKNASKDTQLLDQAERNADEACRLQPTVARFHVVRAVTLLATGQHDRAIPSLEHALHLNHDAAGARKMLARSYVATAQLARAEETLEQGIARRPQDLSVRLELGAFKLNQGQYQQAETHFLAGRQYAPDNLDVIRDLSVLYIMTEMFDAAEQELLRGLALGPDAFLDNNLGWAYFYQEDFPKGVESLVNAVSLAPDNSVMIAGLARGYRWMGRTREARATYERAIRVGRQQVSADAKNVEVRANLAYLYAEIGDRSGAAREIAHALEDAPANVRVRFTSALVFEVMGQRQAALDALKSAIDGGLPKYQITHHPDLRALRTDDRYVALVSHVAWTR